jgi:hypothetical protein
MCFGLLSLLYLWFAFVSFSAIVREIGNAEGTSFRGANLADAKFDIFQSQHSSKSRTIPKDL